VSFTVGADEYDRFMGRYSFPLAPGFAEFAGVEAGQRVIDVGCGPGALVAELIRRLRPEAVWAVDPSERFLAAVRIAIPGCGRTALQQSSCRLRPSGSTLHWRS
jgi:trans-aconitate methyltransferase